MFREEPEKAKRSIIRTETKELDRVLKRVKQVMMTKHPREPGVGRRLRLFHTSYRRMDPGCPLRSGPCGPWSLSSYGNFASQRPVLIQELWEDCFPGYTIARRCPGTVRV